MVTWIKIVEGVTFSIIFCLARPDFKGFAANAAGRLAVCPYMVVWMLHAGRVVMFSEPLTRLHCVPDAIGAFVLGPLMLVLSLAGVAGVARVKFIGPKLVHVILAKDFKFCWAYRRVSSLVLEVDCEGAISPKTFGRPASAFG